MHVLRSRFPKGHYIAVRYGGSSGNLGGRGPRNNLGGIIYPLVEIGLNDLGSVCPPASPVPPSLVAATQILQLKNFFGCEHLPVTITDFFKSGPEILISFFPT